MAVHPPSSQTQLQDAIEQHGLQVYPDSPQAQTRLEHLDPVMSVSDASHDLMKVKSEGKSISKAARLQKVQRPSHASQHKTGSDETADVAGTEESSVPGFFGALRMVGTALSVFSALSLFMYKVFIQQEDKVSKKRLPSKPTSCDTLVILPERASDLPVCFGKNSDRPSDEEHEVVCVPRQRHADGAAVRCTYIEIPQVRETCQVILSKPRWIWGCEMGANEFGVVGGNEAVSTCAESELGSQQRLLGMDLLRLALERGRTAGEAAQICANLLEQHGQGGGCAEDDPSWTYENGFLFADAQEAYVLETAGVSWWAVEQVPSGAFRNISNGISIRSDIHSIHNGLKQHCLDKGWWDGEEPFDFKQVLSGAGGRRELRLFGRERAGFDFLSSLHGHLQSGAVSSGSALAQRMMAILRDERSGICFRDLHGFNSTGSQVSLLGSGQISGGEHFFTCSSDPKVAAYKRFNFAQAQDSSADTIGPLSLELWRQHRKCAIKRWSKDVKEIEGASWPDAVGASSATMLEQIQAELGLFAK